jgi:hypothetical protein
MASAAERSPSRETTSIAGGHLEYRVLDPAPQSAEAEPYTERPIGRRNEVQVPANPILICAPGPELRARLEQLREAGYATTTVETAADAVRPAPPATT